MTTLKGFNWSLAGQRSKPDWTYPIWAPTQLETITTIIIRIQSWGVGGARGKLFYFTYSNLIKTWFAQLGAPVPPPLLAALVVACLDTGKKLATHGAILWTINANLSRLTPTLSITYRGTVNKIGCGPIVKGVVPSLNRRCGHLLV